MTVTEQLLTAEDAANVLQVTPRWLLKEARANRVPHVRLGSRYVRFRESSLLAWAAERERGPVPMSAKVTPQSRRNAA